jgi:hypothetical protein
MATKIKQKTKSYGTARIHDLSPRVLKPETSAVTAHLSFGELLKVKAAIDEAVSVMNRNNRATKEGKRAGTWICFHRDTLHVTVGPCTLSKAKPDEQVGGDAAA